MRKTLWSTLLVALLLGAWNLPLAQADSPGDPKPLAVVAFAELDELLGDIQYVGELADKPQLGKGLRAILSLVTRGKGLVGLDKTRPWGAVLRIDGEKPTGCALLPITDLEQLHQTLKPFIEEVTELDDGVYKVVGKERKKPLFVKEKDGGWLLASDNLQALAHAPADPGELFAELTEAYDVAVRLYVGNVPDEHREKFIAKVKQEAQEKLQRKDGEDEQEFTVRKILTEKLLRAVVCAAKELDQVTLGWSLDREAHNASLEVSATALDGSRAAEHLAKLGQAKTAFGGFHLPGATLTGVCVAECPVGSRDREDLGTVIDAFRTKAFKDIDAKEESKEKAEAGKQLVGGLLDVIEETIASGRLDGGAAVMLKPKGVTLVTGRYIANGQKLEKTLKQLVEAVRKEHPDFVEKVLKTDVAEHNGVRFHTVSLPIPEDAKDREKLVQAVGDPLVIVVGIGPQSFYLSAGKHAVPGLRKAIRRSEDGSPETVPPLQFSVALGDVARFVAAVGKEEQQAAARKAAGVLEKADGQDHVNVSILPIERGVKLRLEAEEGVLKLIGAMRKTR